MEGTGNVAYKIRTLQLSVATPILITDDDKAGRDCAKKAKEAGALPDKFIFCWKRQKIGETELEDLFDPDCYWVAIEGQFGATLDRRPFNGSTEKWSKRMQAGFEASGKPWNSSIENNVKALVASQVAQNPAKALAPDRQELVENVIRSVAKIISGS